MAHHSDLYETGKALCDFLNDLPLLLEVDEVCAILGISESELRSMAKRDQIDLDEDCVMRNDIFKHFFNRIP